MSINPITVSRLKTWTIMGHSNADGWAPSAVTFTNYNHLLPSSGNPVTNPETAYWKNIYVATSAQPYPGTRGTPTASDVGDVAWLEMTVANTGTPDGPHPHPSPYQFPNNRGVCYPHWYFNHYEGVTDLLASFQDDPSERPSGTVHGVEIPFNWLWQHHWNEQVGMVKLAVSSSFFTAQSNGGDAASWLDLVSSSQYTPSDPLYTRSSVLANPHVAEGDPDYRTPFDFNAWWTPGDQFDWAPATDRLYKKWFDKMTGAAAALPTGTKMDVQLAVLWLGDNDSTGRSRAALEESFGRTMKALVKRVRKDLVENDWTTLPESQVRIVIVGVHPTYQNTFSPDFNAPSFCNSQTQAIAADDDFIEWVDSTNWKVLLEDGIDSAAVQTISHFGVEGYQQAAKDIFEAFSKMDVEPFDALDLDEVITLSEARDRVRTYYSRGRSKTDLKDEVVTQHLNASMYHCLNHVGDNAWWLRRRKQIELSAGPTTVMALPKYVHRMMLIEGKGDPDYPLQFEQVGHGEGGKLLINFDERGSGSYWCQFITMPKELSRDDQIVPAPKNITEWIIVEACRRLAAASSNVPLMGHFAGESQQLMTDAMRSMGQVQRTKRDVMRTQRRRPNLGYRRGTGRQRWGSDY